MSITQPLLGVSLAIALFSLVPTHCAEGAEPQAAETSATAKLPRQLPSIDEARRRAELLHETFHATLQVVHQQYFREDEGITIPAATLRSVFRELAHRQQVELRWLAVNAQAMNADHEPASEFEKEAARRIAAGATEHETTADGVYRRVGAITLESECLKCHLPTRTSVRPRAAGLLISMPVRQD